MIVNLAAAGVRARSVSGLRDDECKGRSDGRSRIFNFQKAYAVSTVGRKHGWSELTDADFG